MLTPQTVKVFLKDTAAAQSSNTKIAMCTGAHCFLSDNLKVPEVYHKFKEGPQ